MIAPNSHSRCTTRALKNASFLKHMAPQTFAKNPKAEGFGTGVPVAILRRLHRLRYDSPELSDFPALSEFLKIHTMPLPQRIFR